MERTALSALATILESLSIRWALIGALAANRYRTTPRLTQDVDLLLADMGPGLPALLSALTTAGWRVRHADPKGELVRLVHDRLGIADLLVAGTAYQQEALSRARSETLSDGEVVTVVTAEDVIIHKLIAGRTQDIADIEAIVAGPVPLDDTYISRWSEFWDVAALWSSLRRS